MSALLLASGMADWSKITVIDKDIFTIKERLIMWGILLSDFEKKLFDVVPLGEKQ